MVFSKLTQLLTAAGDADNKVSIKDVISGDYSSGVNSGQLDIRDGIISMCIALALGLLIAVIYKLAFSGVIYSFTFDLSLVLMTVLTSAIIITISSNVVLSLGMVGALSIVRFRTAIKDPVDIMYLFWAISAGIIVGAKQYLFAAILSIVMALICLAAKLLRNGAETYLLVVRYSPVIAESMDKYISSLNIRVRNRTATAESIELTGEISRRNIPERLVEKLSAHSGVYSAVLVSYNGEYCE